MWYEGEDNEIDLLRFLIGLKKQRGNEIFEPSDIPRYMSRAQARRLVDVVNALREREDDTEISKCVEKIKNGECGSRQRQKRRKRGLLCEGKCLPQRRIRRPGLPAPWRLEQAQAHTVIASYL